MSLPIEKRLLIVKINSVNKFILESKERMVHSADSESKHRDECEECSKYYNLTNLSERLYAEYDATFGKDDKDRPKTQASISHIKIVYQ